jgi:hypothetical protein
MIVNDIAEHEDGSATFTIDISDEEKTLLIQEGLTFIFLKAGLSISTKDIIERFKSDESETN